MEIQHKILLPLSLAVCGMLAGCTENLTSSVTDTSEKGFCIYADIKDSPDAGDMKTVFNPESLHVEWSEEDSLSVSVRDGSGTWSNYSFVKEKGKDCFFSDGFSPVGGQKYELYVLYPYDEDFSYVEDDGTGCAPVRIGCDEAIRYHEEEGKISTCYPLYGQAEYSGSDNGETVNGTNVTMKHLSALFEITLANNTDKTVTVTELGLSTDADQVLSGDFLPDFTDGTLHYAGNGSNAAAAPVKEGTILPGETAVFYMACAPFSVSEEDSFVLKVRMTGDEELKFPCTVSSEGYTMKAGTVNRISREIGKVFYKRVTSGLTDWEGDYLVTYTSSDEILVLDGYSKTYGTSDTDLSEELTADGIDAETGDRYKAEIRKSGGGYSIHVSGIGYIGYSGSKNSLSRSDSFDSSTDTWNISADGRLSPANATDRSLKWNTGSPRFACYKETSGGCESVTLYRRSASFSSSVPEPDPEPDPGQDPDPKPDPQPGAGANVNGWLKNFEVPSVSTSLPADKPYSRTVNESYSGAVAYVCETDNPGQLIVTHTFSEGGNRYRNYTLLFDKSRKASLWVAFGMHKNVWDGNSGRNDSWKDDPAIPSDWQSRGCSSPYSRGHQIASGDRQVSVTANKQTFYHSNQAPQWQNGFNGAIWNTLENAIQGSAPTGRDTMYVVTGPIFEDGVTIVDKEGITVPLPVAYWKCIMLCSFDNAGNITGAKGIGYYFPGNKAFSGKYDQYSATIDEIEEICGFDLYANIPKELQDAAESVATPLF